MIIFTINHLVYKVSTIFKNDHQNIIVPQNAESSNCFFCPTDSPKDSFTIISDK